MHDSKSFILTVKVSFQILNIIKALKIDEQVDGLDCAKICKKLLLKFIGGGSFGIQKTAVRTLRLHKKKNQPD